MRLGLEDTGPPLPAEALEHFEYVVEAKAGTRTLTRKASRLAADPLRPGVGRRASVPAGAMPAAMWDERRSAETYLSMPYFSLTSRTHWSYCFLVGRRTFLAIAASMRRRFSCDIRSPS
jgi:hypothetical protein